jgi:hypothetical protein
MCGQAVVSCDGVGVASSVDFFLEELQLSLGAKGICIQSGC